MDDINKVEFLEQQLDLLKRKQKDSNIEWQDIADFRSDYNGESEHRDTIRKGSKLLYEYLDAGWVHEPTSMSISEVKNTSETGMLYHLREAFFPKTPQRMSLWG